MNNPVNTQLTMIDDLVEVDESLKQFESLGLNLVQLSKLHDDISKASEYIFPSDKVYFKLLSLKGDFETVSKDLAIQSSNRLKMTNFIIFEVMLLAAESHCTFSPFELLSLCNYVSNNNYQSFLSEPIIQQSIYYLAGKTFCVDGSYFQIEVSNTNLESRKLGGQYKFTARHTET